MEEPLDKNTEEREKPEAVPPVFSMANGYPPPQIVLITQLILSTLFAIAGGALFMLISLAAGWDSSAIESGQNELRGPLRLMLGLGHFFTFILAGWATLRLYYRGQSVSNPHWMDYLDARRWPGLTLLGLGSLLMLTAMPLVLYLHQLNKMLPLPEVLKGWETGSEETLKALLIMDTPWEFLANVTIIALLPGLGEELIFRGVLQKQLMRTMASPWWAIVVSAAVFSAIHLQFEGFISRWLLGLLLGWLYWFTGNFWVPVVAHFFNNAIQIVGQYAYRNDLSSLDLEQEVTIPWQFAVISAFCMMAVLRLIWQNDQKRSIREG
jgi:uncharacterized protein